MTIKTQVPAKTEFVQATGEPVGTFTGIDEAYEGPRALSDADYADLLKGMKMPTIVLPNAKGPNGMEV